MVFALVPRRIFAEPRWGAGQVLPQYSWPQASENLLSRFQTTEHHVPQTPCWNWNETDHLTWLGDVYTAALTVVLHRVPTHLASGGIQIISLSTKFMYMYLSIALLGTRHPISGFENMVFWTAKVFCLVRCPQFQGFLIRGVPAVLLIEASSFQGVLIRGLLPSCLMSYPHFRES